MSSKNDSQVVVERASIDYSGFTQMKNYTLKHALHEGGWSQTLEREVNLRRDAVTVLPVDIHTDQVILVEQFRIGPYAQGEDAWLKEVVAGIIEPNETKQAVAVRELMEETGCQALNSQFIFDYFPSPGGSAEKISLFVCQVNSLGVREFHGCRDEGEDIRVHVMAIDNVLALLANGQITSAPTIIALQWLSIHYPNLKRDWLA